MTFSRYMIAAGANVALTSLTNIETIKPSGDRYFYAPQAIPFGSPGQRKRKLNGVAFFAGYPAVDWRFAVLTRKQYEYLKSTYCSGSYSGLVTIYTTLSGNTFARYNAVIDVPETAVIPEGYFAYKNVSVRFTHLVAL